MRRLVAVGLLRKLPPSGGRRTATYEIVFEAKAVGAGTGASGDAAGNRDGDASGNSAGDSSGSAAGDAEGNRIITEYLNIASEQRHTELPVDIEALFEKFWQAYPSRSPLPNPKEPAREAFVMLVRRGIKSERLIEAAKNFAAAMTEEQKPRFIPYTVNWLKKGSFPENRKPLVPNTGNKGLSEAEWRLILKAYKAGDCRAAAWPKGVGLPPEHRATRVPLAIRSEFGFSN